MFVTYLRKKLQKHYFEYLYLVDTKLANKTMTFHFHIPPCVRMVDVSEESL